MRVHALLLTGCALCLAACGKQEPADSGQAVTDAAAAAEEGAAQQARFDRSFIDHMHVHAEQLDELMFALADDDLDAALTPAFWLSRHDTVEGIPEEWQQYVTGMRKAAAAVGAARDLETARIAAESISDQCQSCHNVAGVNGPTGG